MIAFNRSRIWELIMRFSPAAIGLSLLLAVASSATFSQPADYQVDPRSTLLIEEGLAAQKGGDLNGAIDFYEAALAIDPGNRNAYIALAQVARAQDLPGKAIRLYREALLLNPNDLAALAGEGEALVQRGAVEKARLNLSRIKSLCRDDCPEEGQLLAAIEASDKTPVLSAEAVQTTPTVTGGSSEQP